MGTASARALCVGFVALGLSIERSADAQTLALLGPVSGARPITGVTVDGFGVDSRGAGGRAGTFELRMPARATIVRATLFVGVRQSFATPITPTPAPTVTPAMAVTVAGQRFLVSAMTQTGTDFGPSRTFSWSTWMTDCTAALTTFAASSPTSAAGLTNVSAREEGDLADNAITGSVLVVEFSVAAHPVRNVSVYSGAVGAFGTTVTRGVTMIPAAMNHVACAAGMRAEPIVTSLTITSSPSPCEENADVVVTTRTGTTFVLSQNAGGSDDGVSRCADATSNTGAITTGSFGINPLLGVGAGGPEGIGADALSAPFAADVDELFAFPQTYQNLTVTDTNGPLSVLVVQSPNIRGDRDGDSVADGDEGYCESTDSDGDGAQDWLDADSDNDCILDAEEPDGTRTATATLAESDARCAARLAGSFCMGAMGCARCGVVCAGSALGRVCVRDTTRTLVCGCNEDMDCDAGSVCDRSSRACGPRADGGAEASVEPTVSNDAAADSAVDASDERAMGDDALVIEAGDDAGEALDGSRRPTTVYRGGACTCSTAGVTRSGGPWALALALSMIAARRARRR